MNEYRRGSNFERRVMRHLEKEGWFCFRSAGSKKPADVIAFRCGEVMLIQCQLGSYFAPSKREQLYELATKNGFQSWLAWRDGNKLVMQQQFEYVSKLEGE